MLTGCQGVEPVKLQKKDTKNIFLSLLFSIFNLYISRGQQVAYGIELVHVRYHLHTHVLLGLPVSGFRL